MKAIIKNQTRKQISVAIVAVCVLFIGSSVAVAEEPLLLASLTRITPLEDFENYDKFPGYHRETLKAENETEIKVEMDIIEEIKRADQEDALDTAVSSVAWVGKKAIDGYTILNGDYGKLLTGLLTD